MDGRLVRVLAGGLLGSLVGCASLQNHPNSAASVPAPTQPTPAAPVQSSVATPAPANAKLKPSTIVSIGATKEQAAEEPDHTPAEREQFRYQARQAYLQAIQADPKYVPAYVALGRSYYATNERDKARDVFQKATVINPKDGSLWFELATCQARAKEMPAAVESLTKATKLDPENKNYQKTLGFALARIGKYDDAYAALAKCMSETEAHYNLARMLQHMGQTDAARQQANLALKSNPDYTPASDLLAAMANPPSAIKTARYEEPATLPAAFAPPKSTAPQPRVAPVLLGGQTGTPIKVAFDGIE